MANLTVSRDMQWRIARWGAASTLLLLPLIAMHFTDEVQWSPGDFVFMGALLSILLGLYELAVRLSGDLTYRAAVGVGAVTSFLLIWINAAVGIIGNEDNDANLMFAGVLLVGFIGTCIARFEVRPMAFTLYATAAAQALVGVIVLLWGLGDDKNPLLLIAGFTSLWILSGRLFARASLAEKRP
jgi:hypothetical protein